MPIGCNINLAHSYWLQHQSRVCVIFASPVVSRLKEQLDQYKLWMFCSMLLIVKVILECAFYYKYLICFSIDSKHFFWIPIREAAKKWFFSGPATLEISDHIFLFAGFKKSCQALNPPPLLVSGSKDLVVLTKITLKYELLLILCSKKSYCMRWAKTSWTYSSKV